MLSIARAAAARSRSSTHSHPILEIFKAPRSGNLSTARFFRYRAIAMKPDPPGDKEGEPAPTRRVVARFDDGSVAMAERRIGSGHVMLWASTLDNYWNDLALKAVYLPFVHEVIRHLATYEEPANWFTIGEVIDPGHLLRSSGVGLQSGTGAMVLTPNGQRIEQSGTPTPVQLDQQGFYEVRGRSNQSGTVSIAANLDTAESDLAMLDTQELSAALAGRPGSVNAAAADAATDHSRRSGASPELLVVSARGGPRAAGSRDRDFQSHEGSDRRHTAHANRRGMSQVSGCAGRGAPATDQRLSLPFLFRTILRDSGPPTPAGLAAVCRRRCRGAGMGSPGLARRSCG